MRKQVADPLRQEVNQHLWRDHGRQALQGTTEERLYRHALMHEEQPCSHFHLDETLTVYQTPKITHG